MKDRYYVDGKLVKDRCGEWDIDCGDNSRAYLVQGTMNLAHRRAMAQVRETFDPSRYGSLRCYLRGSINRDFNEAGIGFDRLADLLDDGADVEPGKPIDEHPDEKPEPRYYVGQSPHEGWWFVYDRTKPWPRNSTGHACTFGQWPTKPEAEAEAARLNAEAEKPKGRRITRAEALDIARDTLKQAEQGRSDQALPADPARDQRRFELVKAVLGQVNCTDYAEESFGSIATCAVRFVDAVIAAMEAKP